ncbi:MAG: class I SAM-dependent methyltransferase [Planctomycetota bacterium]|jgi:hypothetical protein
MPTGVYDQAELYCAAFDWPVDNEVDWLLGLFPEIRSVLEPFCGQSRFARAFRDRGIEFLGVDRSRAMLDRAPAGDGITLVCADATSFDVGRTVDLAWCPINSVCHLAEERDIAGHLRSVRRHLPAGGAYVVEIELLMHDGPWDRGTPERSTWSMPQADGTAVRATVTREDCDAVSRTCTERAWYRRVRGDEVLASAEELFTMRMWTHADLVRLAGAAGFALEATYRNEGSRGRPAVEPGPHLENDGENHYFVLRAR